MARFLGVERKNGYLCIGGYGPLAGCAGMFFCGDRGSCGASGGGGAGLRVRPTCVGVLLSDVGE